MSEYRIGDYNRGGFIAFIFSMGFTVAFFIYIALIHPGIDLHEIQSPETQKEATQKDAPSAQPATEQAAPAN